MPTAERSRRTRDRLRRSSSTAATILAVHGGPMHLTRFLLVAAATLVALPEPVVADPPPWAPAHGWRKKNDPNYVGYTGTKWENDYGVLAGRCDAAKVGTVLGGVAGGVIGSQVAKDSPNRPVAILVGTVIGAVIGNKIGTEIDSGDRGG